MIPHVGFIHDTDLNPPKPKKTTGLEMIASRAVAIPSPRPPAHVHNLGAGRQYYSAGNLRWVGRLCVLLYTCVGW